RHRPIEVFSPFLWVPATTQSGHQKAECYEGDHIGGLMPLRPTEMFDARIVPSGSFFAAAEKTFSPGLGSASVAGAKLQTATFGGTSNVFSPSLYFKTRVLPLLLATWVAIVALVIVLLGMRSQERWPSPVPRIASGKM